MDLTSMYGNNILTDCQANPASGVLFTPVNPLKDVKYFMDILRVNTYPIIRNVKLMEAAFFFRVPA